MGFVAKVHLIRSEKSTAEIRDPEVAQQNFVASKPDALHKYFEEALMSHGGVFDSSTRPVVAGMILDTHYSAGDDFALGHAALGCHNPKGLSLGVFGSHLTYSWPRFFEEIAACLTDTTPPGDMVCNDNGECETAWEACSIGQGSFLHEVGHAFGASHTTGIMHTGYAQDWPKNFLTQTAYCTATDSDGTTVIDRQTANEACWDVRDALSFRCLAHFRLPGDDVCTEKTRTAKPSIRLEDSQGESPRSIIVECRAGIALVRFSNASHATTPAQSPNLDKSHTRAVFQLEDFDRSKPLAIQVIGQNGKECRYGNAWRLLPHDEFIRIPDSDIVLRKRSVSGMGSKEGQYNGVTNYPNQHFWTVMLQEKGPSGNLSHATAVDLRVGCTLDGAVVYYDDGHTTPCGLRRDNRGNSFEFGSHASEKLEIPAGVENTEVEVRAADHEGSILKGIRVSLSNGCSAGELNDQDDSGVSDVLEPRRGEKIVGFYGRSEIGCGHCLEFGIVTVDKGVELPPQVFDMVELQNIQEK